MKNPVKVKQGKKNKKDGAAFELKVRKDLEEKGWIVAKWMNNVEFIEVTDEQIVEARQNIKKYGGEKDHYIEPKSDGKLIPAKHKFCGLGRPMAIGTGFPDFICFKDPNVPDYVFPYKEIIGVESKSNGTLSKEEKEKCAWLLENQIFSKILIASKEKEGRKTIVKYKEFEK